MKYIIKFAIGGVNPILEEQPPNVKTQVSPNLIPTYKKPNIVPYRMNKFLFKDRQNGILIGGLSPTFSGENISISPFMVGVGGKSFINPAADYGIRGSYNPSNRLQLDAGISKGGGITAGLKYKFKEGGNMKYKIKEAKSGIYINPANKGKFTATKKATGKSTEELTHSKNPLTKKRAIFAQNAKK